MRFHWQNLNDRKRVGGMRVTGSGLRHGRAWLDTEKRGYRLEWVLGKMSFGAYVSFNGSEREILFHLAVPLITLYFSFNSGWEWLWKKTGYDHRRIGFRIFDWAFWWSCWENEMSWSSREPWWMHWTFHLDNFILGDVKHKQELHGNPIRIWIPLPEGQYLAEAQYETRTWTRARWPWWPCKVVRQATAVDVHAWHGLPHEGKGENSWDCGTDGLFGYSSDGHSVEAAIAKGVESTLKDRNKYGGAKRGAYPDPHITKIAGLKAFAELLAHMEKLRERHPKWGTVTWNSELVDEIYIINIIESGIEKNHYRSITTTPALHSKWYSVLEKARSTVVLKDDDSVAEATA
jgi:hypothetical protein